MIEPGAVVGFVGLGKMGSPMATRLAEAGYQVQAYDVSDQAARAWAERAGASPAASLRAMAAGAAAVVLMLPDSAVVRTVLDDLLPELAAGTVVVDMSSSEPLVTRELAAEAARHRVTLVDAPVSGGVTGAVSGRLTIMAGGAPSAWPRPRAPPPPCRPPRYPSGPRPPRPCPRTPTTPRSPAGSRRYPGARAWDDSP